MPKLPRWLDALWLGALLLYIAAGTSLTPFHGDESAFVLMSNDYAYQFIERDLTPIYHSETPVAPAEQDFRLLNGTLHKYAVGLAWHLAGYTQADLTNQWDWGADWAYNVNNGNMPPDDLLQVARIPSVLAFMLAVIVAYAVGDTVGGRVAALAFTTLFALNPALLLNGRRAMQEGVLLLFSLLVVLAALRWVRVVARDPNRIPRPLLAWTALLALGSGMAVAAKHPNVMTVGAVFFACGVVVIYHTLRNRAALVRLLGLLTVAGVASIGVFFLLNPAYWQNPYDAARTALGLRQGILGAQINAFETYNSFGDGLVGFGREVFGSVPMYYEAPNFANWIGDQIAAYEASPWSGLWLGASLPSMVLLVMLTAIGGWWLWRQQDNGAVRFVVVTWAVLVSLAVLITTPFEWQRYYLPVITAMLLFAGLGVAQVWAWAIAAFRAPSPDRAKAPVTQ